MAGQSPAAGDTQGFTPLGPLLRAVGPSKLYEARQRVLSFRRDELLVHYRAAFTAGQRMRAFLMAEGLALRGVPPFVMHEGLTSDSLDVNQRYGLFLADLIWLRHQYPAHADVVRYQRGRAMLTGAEPVLHREAEFAFYRGIRPAWKLVGSLSLTERQQWDCTWLRSAPIKKRAAATEAASGRVRETLQYELRKVRRTATFGDAEAEAALCRRHALWLCSRMGSTAGPTEVAERYEQLTGLPITRQAAAQQLEKVRAAVRKIEMCSGLKAR